ncbi:MAG: hypothetical protein V3T77_01940 [Planctomycetota bacterium]
MLLLTLVTGCTSTIDGRRGLPPLFEYSPALKDAFSWTLAPLVARDRSPALSKTSVLWPIYHSSQREQSSRGWMLPLVYWSTLLHSTGELDKDRIAFPFFWGSDPSEGGYFLLFPIGGTLKGFFAQDRIDMVLLLLYLRLRDRNRISQHVLWPFFNWVRGPTRHGWRFWPLYGRYTATTLEGIPKYDRRFYLWPFFISQENNLDTDRPAKVRWFWPFWGQMESKYLQRYSVLWPFICWEYSQRPPYTLWQVFPLRIANGENRKQRDLWPLIGYKRTEHNRRWFFLWPLGGTQQITAKGNQETYRWFVPLYWSWRRENLETGVASTGTHVWPLYSWRHSAAGKREFNLLNLLPIEAPHFERTWARLWRIYRYIDNQQEGTAGWEFLWGLAKGKRGPDHRSFSILGGLVGREVRDGSSRWRIFYIPF